MRLNIAVSFLFYRIIFLKYLISLNLDFILQFKLIFHVSNVTGMRFNVSVQSFYFNIFSRGSTLH